MRIVHFDQMFHPEFGDQINILPKFQVRQGHEVYIVTGKVDVPHPRFKNFADNNNIDEKDKQFEDNSGVKIIRIDIKKFISGRAIYKKGYKQLVDGLNPDILFCHFNDTVVGMHYTLLASKLKYPVVFDSHMLPMASQNSLNKQFRLFYKTFITPIIKKNNLLVIRTQDDNYVNKYLGIPEDQTPFISFGSDTTLFYPDSSVKTNLRRKYAIQKDDFVVVYTGKLSEDKGGRLLGEAFQEKFNTNKNVVLLVVGNTRSAYEYQVEEMLLKSENRIIRFPTQKYIDLPQFYQMADLCVFPKQCSLSFYDAQACGLPVVSEDNNINIDRLKYDNGINFRAGDVKDFREKIKYLVEMNDDDYNRMKFNAINFIKESYDYKYIAKQYTDLMTQECDKFNNKM